MSYLDICAMFIILPTKLYQQKSMQVVCVLENIKYKIRTVNKNLCIYIDEYLQTKHTKYNEINTNSIFL